MQSIPTWFSLLIVAALAAAAFGWGAVWLQAEWDANEHVGQFIMPPVRLGEPAPPGGDIRSGDGRPAGWLTKFRAARLARYAALARVDPIFGLSGVDTSKLDVAVAAFSKSLAAFAQTGGDGIAGDLLPSVGFLKILPALEERRRELIVHPSIGAARLYQQALEWSVDQAIADVGSLRDRIREADAGRDPAGGNRPIVFLRTATDRETVLAGLRDVGTAFRRQQAKARARAGCLSVWGSCPDVRYGWSDFVNRNPDAGAPASAVNARVVRLLQSHWTEDGVSLDPRVFWVETPCFGGGPTYRPFSFLTLPPAWAGRAVPDWQALGLGSIPKPDLLDNLYFLALDRLATSTREHYWRFLGGEVPFNWQLATNFYACLDAAYWAELTSLAHLVAVMSQPDFLRIADADADPELTRRILELQSRANALAAGRTIHGREVQAFVSDVGTLLLERGEPALARTIGAAGAVFAQEFVQQYFERSAAFDNIVTEGVIRHYRMLASLPVERPGASVPPLYYLVTHSHPSLYFLTFNYSFIGAGAAPSFIARGLLPERTVFIDMAVGGAYSDQELLEVMARAAASVETPVQ